MRDRARDLTRQRAELGQDIPGPTPDWPGGWVLERVGADHTTRQFLTPRNVAADDRRPAWPAAADAAAAATPRSMRSQPLRATWTPVSPADNPAGRIPLDAVALAETGITR